MIELVAAETKSSVIESERAVSLSQSLWTRTEAEKEAKAEPRQIPPNFMNLDEKAQSIGKMLNEGRSDWAALSLSESLRSLDIDLSNQLLLKIKENEEAEEEGDDRAHLLLSDWNQETNTWDQVYIEEGSQLYRIVSPGNTLSTIARDRLGEAASATSVDSYVQNIKEVNRLSAEQLSRGQALRLPFPY